MKQTPYLIVSVHDVSPEHWNRVQRILVQLEAIGVKRRSLLVIPNSRGQSPVDEDSAFSGWLREQQNHGDELILHGYEHVGVGKPESLADRIRNRLFTQNEGEFLSLNYAEARRRIELGVWIFKAAALRSRGFIPPAWLINRDGLAAARDMGFEYTNSYMYFSDLTTGNSFFAPSLVFGPGTLNEDVGIALQSVVSKLLVRRPLVRVVIHPPCIDNPRRFAQILEMVKAQLAHHEPVTYSDLLSTLRERTAGMEQSHLAGGMRA
ncbi:MAG TPA: polysaccharide deacetylase family protein [Terriglobia bacterium]|nr:polysaccharide deacetylase family protein [Terriglobia bacterium]